eukprot:TRINITY_DN6886_c0_g1_i1.p1 TRINITY_DN6886_c0_g1~~TRINITY_DN6886_c0_g1_i1.p1  ORF type:complete len:871 (-),score=113.10 TRINITY_DN6886_c0_g1_i1:55-2667(-)
MMIIVLIAALFASAVCQTGALTVKNITSGIKINGNLPVSTSDTRYDLDLYKFWVPENTSSVQVNFTVTECTVLNFWVNTFGVPCHYFEYSSFRYSPCNENWAPGSSGGGSGTSHYSGTLKPSTYDSGFFQYAVGKYWYFAVGKNDDEEESLECSYDLSVSIASDCPTGQVGFAVSETSTICAPYNDLTNVALSELNHTENLVNFNAAGNDQFKLYKLNVPQDTAWIRVLVNASVSNSIKLTGRNYASGSPFTPTSCEKTYSSYSGYPYAVYDMHCYTPRAGSFFISLFSSQTNYNATIEITGKVCANLTGGYDCLFPSKRLTSETFSGQTQVTIPHHYNGTQRSYGALYYYIDVPVSGGFSGVTFDAFGVDKSVVIFRRDAFPTFDLDSGVDTAYEVIDAYNNHRIITFNEFNLNIMTGRIYIALVCKDTSEDCVVQVSANFTYPATTTNATSASTTSASTHWSTLTGNTPPTGSSKVGAIVGSTVSIGVVFTGVFVVIIIIRKKNAAGKGEQGALIYMNSMDKSHLSDERKSTQLARKSTTNNMNSISNITIQSKLGEGHFGQVHLGIWNGTKVAMKQTTGDLKEILQESQLLFSLRHPNVVNMLGTYSAPNGDFFMVMEFIPTGDLKSHLTSKRLENKLLTERNFAEIVSGTAKGMAYLESVQVVHRDLALRNLLFTRGYEGEYLVKITDFGLSRDLDGEYYKASESAVLPVRWTAPECFVEQKATSKSDVWSFGITMWEAYEYGATPWAQKRNAQIIEAVCAGERLQQPRNCPDDMWQIFTSCCELSPKDRPTFAKIVELVIKDEGGASKRDSYSLTPTAQMPNQSDYSLTAETVQNNQPNSYATETVAQQADYNSITVETGSYTIV